MLLLCAIYLTVFAVRGLCDKTRRPRIDVSLKNQTIVSFGSGQSIQQSPGHGAPNHFTATDLSYTLETLNYREPYMPRQKYKDFISLTSLMILEEVSDKGSGSSGSHSDDIHTNILNFPARRSMKSPTMQVLLANYPCISVTACPGISATNRPSRRSCMRICCGGWRSSRTFLINGLSWIGYRVLIWF